MAAHRRLLVVAVPTLILSLVAIGWMSVFSGSPGVTRTYYIAADEVMWDYVPGGTNLITGEPFEEFPKSFWVESGPKRVGHIYKKAIYREYTDSTFTTLKPRAPEWEHLGMLGPLVRAEVGDTIRIVFRNNASHAFSMHPHGVIYEKSSEGAIYSDGTSGDDKADDAVPPGGTHVYIWPVPERAGPTKHEGSTALWMYHSHNRETGDVNAGLVGPLIVTRRGAAHPDGSPRDVDREIVMAFAEIDENLSPYLDENLKLFTPNPDEVTPEDRFTFLSPFYLSNLRQTMNGLSFGHTPMVTLATGERVRWYLLATTNFEIHSPHWHGNVVVAHQMRTDVTALMSMGMVVADMIPDNPGIWLFHCHVGPHLDAGMQTRFTVTPHVASR